MNVRVDSYLNSWLIPAIISLVWTVVSRGQQVTAWSWFTSFFLAMDNFRLQIILGNEWLEWEGWSRYTAEIHGWGPTAHRTSLWRLGPSDSFDALAETEWIEIDETRPLKVCGSHIHSSTAWYGLGTCTEPGELRHLNQPSCHLQNEWTFLAWFHFSSLRDPSSPCSADPV